MGVKKRFVTMDRAALSAFGSYEFALGFVGMGKTSPVNHLSNPGRTLAVLLKGSHYGEVSPLKGLARTSVSTNRGVNCGSFPR
jgi:hypothetical protein